MFNKIAALMVVIICAFPCISAAQSDSRGFSLMNFQAAPGHGSYLSVEGARLPEKFSFLAGAFLNYQYKPLVVRSCEQADGNTCTEWLDKKTPLIEHRLVGEVLLAASFWGIIEAGAAIPVVLYQEGKRVTGTATTNVIESPDSTTGLEDIRLHLKLDILGGIFDYDGGKTGLSIALVPVVSFPVGNAVSEDSFMGDSFLTFHPKAAIGMGKRRFRGGLNAGYLMLEEKETYLAQIGSRITYGAAAELYITNNFCATLEAFGQVAVKKNRASAPLEAAIAGKYDFKHGISVTAGIGAGIIHGPGTPTIRGLAAITWTPLKPDNKPGRFLKDVANSENDEPKPVFDLDKDKDGIEDGYDECPDQPEDKDDFEDDDGCPDMDNDLDFISDDNDKCPLEKEVFNGTEDEDGCPDEGDELVSITETRLILSQPIQFRGKNKKIKDGVSSKTLSIIATILKISSSTRIRVEGHTNNKGSKRRNLKNSLQQANTIVKYLVKNGVAKERLEAEGHGGNLLLVEQGTKKEKEKNNRIEIHILPGLPEPDDPVGDPDQTSPVDISQ